MYVYSCNALSAQFFDVDRALNSYFMIMIMIRSYDEYCELQTKPSYACIKWLHGYTVGTLDVLGAYDACADMGQL